MTPEIVGQNGNCVEDALTADGGRAVRDRKNPALGAQFHAPPRGCLPLRRQIPGSAESVSGAAELNQDPPIAFPADLPTEEPLRREVSAWRWVSSPGGPGRLFGDFGDALESAAWEYAVREYGWPLRPELADSALSPELRWEPADRRRWLLFDHSEPTGVEIAEERVFVRQLVRGR